MRAYLCPWVPLSNMACVAVAIAAALLLAALPARADVLNVDCTGADPTAFPTITAALNSLPVNSTTEPHAINVIGPCNENIVFNSRERIVIQGPANGTATIMAANPASRVFTINRSRDIELRRLVISGGAGVGVDFQSSVVIQGCTIENGSGPALNITGSSTVRIGGALASQAVHINNNGLTTGRNAVNVIFSFLTIAGNTTIENNGNAPLNVNAGALSVDGTSGENFFRNNGFGVNLAQGSVAQFVGQNTIQNNGGLGLQVMQSSTAQFLSSTLAGAPRVTIIEGHTALGVNIVRLGEVTFVGPHRIYNNGYSPTDPALQSGIRVRSSSLRLDRGTEISGNFGPGIRLEANSSLATTDAVIGNNGAEGVRVIRQSVAEFTGGNVLTGNGSHALTCDTTSLAFGDFTNIGSINCNRIEREIGPPRGGAIVEH